MRFENEQCTREQLLKEVLSLPVQERAEIVEALLSSLDEPDSTVDALWAKEAEARLDACSLRRTESHPASRRPRQVRQGAIFLAAADAELV